MGESEKSSSTTAKKPSKRGQRKKDGSETAKEQGSLETKEDQPTVIHAKSGADQPKSSNAEVTVVYVCVFGCLCLCMYVCMCVREKEKERRKRDNGGSGTLASSVAPARSGGIISPK